MKKTIIIFVFVVLILLLFIYLFILFILPQIINSKNFQKQIVNFIFKKSHIKTEIVNLNYKTNFDLSSGATVEKLILKNKNNEIFLSFDNAKADFRAFKLMPKKIKIDYLVFNKTKYESQNKSKFQLKNLPELAINKIDIILENNSLLSLNNLETSYEQGKYAINFHGEISSKYISSKIKLKEQKNLFIQNEELIASDFEINFKNSPLIINGKLISKNSYNFTLKGSSIPIKEIAGCFLFYRKQIKPQEKNFIENFYNFRGLADINLRFKKKRIDGIAVLNNFQAKSVKFNIPFYYPKGIFYFNGDKISLKTKGTFGKEELYTDFFANKIFEKDRISRGSLISNVGDGFIKRYFSYAKIQKRIGLEVKYKIQFRKPEVEYFAKIPKGANIYYKKMNLGLVNLDRTIYAKTIKKENHLYLKTYNYSANKKIIYGDGLFTRKNNKFYLDNISLNTLDFAPVSIIGIDDEYLKEGVFKGKLKYFTKDDNINGDIELYFKKFVHPKAVLENIHAIGSVKNSIINFVTKEIFFAKGILSAKGIYDFKKHNTDIIFSAKNIDTNIASNNLLNLKEQFEGKGDAVVYFKSFNKFKTVCAHCDFSIKEGKLTKLLNRELLIKNSKIKLKNIVQINPKKTQAMISDIKGSFDIYNYDIKNIEIFNKSSFLSLYAQGNYNIKSECACLNLWGRYNKKALDGIKVFFIPLSWVVKFVFKNEYTKDCYKKEIEKIPSISPNSKEEIILVNIEGNINSFKNLQITLRNIR